MHWYDGKSFQPPEVAKPTDNVDPLTHSTPLRSRPFQATHLILSSLHLTIYSPPAILRLPIDSRGTRSNQHTPLP
jgi:hypothetical protein